MSQELTPQERSHLAMASTVFGPGQPRIDVDTETVRFPNHLPRQPEIGDVVVFFPNPDDSVAKSNSAKVCPAFITRVWGPAGCCNLKLIPDHGPMQDRGSVSHKSGNIAGYSWCYKDEFTEGVRRGLWLPSEF